MEILPIPAATDDQKAELAALAEEAQAAAEARLDLQRRVARRIPDLAADPTDAVLSTRLHEWWTLPDLAAFRKEVQKALKADVSLKERNEWEAWLADTRAEIDALTTRIKIVEAEINARVYALFELAADEIDLLEASI